MYYIKDGAAAADPWVYTGGDEPVPADVPAIVSAERLFAAAQPALPDDGGLESPLTPTLSRGGERESGRARGEDVPLSPCGRGDRGGGSFPRRALLGVAWPNNRPVSELAPYLSQLALIALEFPVFRDGRAYSQARRLRERHGFKGEIRATGDVLRDQFLFMARAGFNAFEVKKAKDAEAFARALGEFSIRYQPAGGDEASFRTRIRGAFFPA